MTTARQQLTWLDGKNVKAGVFKGGGRRIFWKRLNLSPGLVVSEV